MKFSAALSLAIAPVALGKAVHNVYPVRRDGHLNAAERGGEGRSQGSAGALAGVGVGGGQIVQAVGSTTEVIIIWANPGAGAATTTLNQQVTVTQTVTQGATGGAVAAPPVGTASAPGGVATAPAPGAVATHAVTVGGTGGLAFTPSEIKAAMGDMVVFTFQSANHSATQSAFTTPCDPLAGGMDSGFQANPNNTVNPPPQVAMQVMTTTPLWFYCKQTGHCGKGMTFSINPTADKTQAMFQSMAITQKGRGGGSAITGNGTAAVPPAAGSSSVVAAPPAGTGVAGGAGGVGGAGGINQGTGQLANGQCVCAVSCGTGAFPAVQAQGVGAFGGIPGALPASMMEA